MYEYDMPHVQPLSTALRQSHVALGRIAHRATHVLSVKTHLFDGGLVEAGLLLDLLALLGAVGVLRLADRHGVRGAVLVEDDLGRGGRGLLLVGAVLHVAHLDVRGHVDLERKLYASYVVAKTQYSF